MDKLFLLFFYIINIIIYCRLIYVNCGIREIISRHSECKIIKDDNINIFEQKSIYNGFNNINKKDINNIHYTPDWESLDSRIIPEWYENVKFGIFIHWGVYSVPSYDKGAAEWFWEHIDGNDTDSIIFMKKNYPPYFKYNDFVKNFNADLYNSTEWVKIIKNSGAKYIVITSKHHEGYCLWDSPYSLFWNSLDCMPHKNLLNELFSSLLGENYDILYNLPSKIKHKIEKILPNIFSFKKNNIYNNADEKKHFQKHINNITNYEIFNTNPYDNIPVRFGLYYSLYEWFNPLYENDRKNNFTTDNYVNLKVIPELHDLIHKFFPSIIWSDGDWEALDIYWKSKEFLTYVYNDSPIKEYIVTNDRWGKNTNCKHGGFLTCQDRFNPHQLLEKKYENCLTIDKNSWGYRRNANLNDYLTIEELIYLFISTLAFGGNFLLNISPRSDGVISPIYEEKLKLIGDFVKINQEGIYMTTYWNIKQEEKYILNYCNGKNDDIIYNNLYFYYQNNEIQNNNNKYTFSNNTDILIGTCSLMQKIYYVIPNKNHEYYMYDYTDYNNYTSQYYINNTYKISDCLAMRNKNINDRYAKINLGNSNGIIYAYFFVWPNDSKVKFEYIIVDNNTKVFLISSYKKEIPLKIYRREYIHSEERIKEKHSFNTIIELPFISPTSLLAKQPAWLIKFVYFCQNGPN